MAPNWCSGNVKVKGKSENVRDFCRLFIFEDEANKDKKKGEYFARSFLHERKRKFEKEFLGCSEVEFSVDFAWSAFSCLIEGYPEDYDECITLKEGCKRYDVEVEITTSEEGMCFEETIKANKRGVKYSSKTMPTYECECGASQHMSSDDDIDEVECCECGEVGRAKSKNPQREVERKGNWKRK